MPLNFSLLCDLLTQLERIENQIPPPPPLSCQRLKSNKVKDWFKLHRNEIDNVSPEALLSSLLPHRRRDRNYCIQEKRLSRIIGQTYSLGSSRLKDLSSYTNPGRGDLGTCVERVTKDLGPPAIPRVSVEELDSSLSELASRSRFAGPKVRLSRSDSDLDRPLEWLYLRMDPCQAKWLTRVVLKDIARFLPGDYQVMRAYHFLLPDLLRFQDSLPDALALLKGHLGHYPAVPEPEQELAYKHEASLRLCPQVGVKVGRPSFIKARSIQNCLKLVGGRRWSAERKYDGEHCEIHIDMSKGSQCIQIYSKSGKDSTQDRSAVHSVIRESLRIGKSDCPIKSTCIVLGELVVYSDTARDILEFAKLRKHVSRSGSFLGTENDSQAHPHEHLMVIFYDLLMIDDEMAMNEPYQERRTRLSSILTKRPGRAMTAERKLIDFSSTDARETLMEHFAWSITSRWEGLVLKPANSPYFSLHDSDSTSEFRGFIKIKRDYITGIGDEADFAVIGASYNVRDAEACGTPKPRWTSFYLGCLENKNDVLDRDARPKFRVVDLICCRACIPKTDLETLCEHGQFSQQPFRKDESPEAFDVSIGDSLPPMQTIFSSPLVVEVLGSAFERPAGANFYSLRHPRIRKVHLDRSWKDTIGFSELQEFARKVREPPPEDESQELEKWVNAIRKTVPQTRNAKFRSPISSPVTPEPSRAHRTADTTPETTASESTNRSLMDGATSITKSNVQTLVKTFISSRPPQARPDSSPSLARGSTCTESKLKLPIFEDAHKIRSTPVVRQGIEHNQEPRETTQQPSKLGKRARDDSDEADGSSHKIGAMGPPKRARYSKAPNNEQAYLEEKRNEPWAQSKEPLTDVTNSPDHRQISPDVRSVTTDYTDSEHSSKSSKVVRISLLRREKKMIISPPVIVRQKATRRVAEQRTSPMVLGTPNTTPTIQSFLRPRFDTCILYLAPCIARCPWVAEDLISTHGAFRVQYLDQWVRQRGFDADPQDDSVVYESQSYTGLQKAVLLETRRRKASLMVVQEVLDLELREKVMLWDWRVLEELHAETSDANNDVHVAKHFFGVIDWDGEERCHFFADSSGARQRISYEE